MTTEQTGFEADWRRHFWPENEHSVVGPIDFDSKTVVSASERRQRRRHPVKTAFERLRDRVLERKNAVLGYVHRIIGSKTAVDGHGSVEHQASIPEAGAAAMSIGEGFQLKGL